MKKWIILILALSLLGCQPTKVGTKKVIEPKIKEEIVGVIEMPDVNTDGLKALLQKANQAMMVIEIETLHKQISDALLLVVDFDIDLEMQNEAIEEIVRNEVKVWRDKTVEEVLKSEQVTLNTNNLEDLIEKTTYKAMYQVMLDYEMIFLKNYKQ